MSLLVLQDVTLRFGGLVAVHDLGFAVEREEVVSVIGPNGAGKTTVFNCITGFLRPTQGSIRLDGQELVGLKPFQVARHGLARTFQNIRLFPRLTAMENAMAGVHLRTRAHILSAVLRSPAHHREEAFIRQEAERWLEMVDLYGQRERLAANLPYGAQRSLEIARAMATSPKLLLLDEPAAGLNHDERQELIKLITKIRELGTTIVLIEHDMRLVMEISDRLVVLDHGEKIAEGLPEEVQQNPLVVAAYLGSGG